MTFGYQQQHVLESTAARAAILNLDARHNRLYSAGDRGAVAGHLQAHRCHADRGRSDVLEDLGGVRRWRGQARHRRPRDRGRRRERDTALRGNAIRRSGATRAVGTYTDALIYERGGWYYASRTLPWDTEASEPS